jgi:CHAT domain
VTRSVLLISEREDGQLAASVENAEPPLPPNYDERIAFGYASAGLPPLDDAAQYGGALVEGLRKHPAVAALLDRAFGTAIAKPHTLALLVRAGDGRQIRWEALRDDQGKFVALDGRCPIGRITRRLSGTPNAAQAFEPPLRILAYVSGIGLDMQAEWDALAAAVDAARAAGLPVKATVHIGPDALREQARAECAAGQHPAISVEAMPQAAFELEQQIQRARAHVLHFFCHGQGGMGASFLELATAQDHALNRPGSVVLDTDTLAGIAALREAWLVVLNCCEGAQGNAEIESMAERLVAQTGTRAIGMLEPVASGEASRFTAALYPELFRLLDGVLRMAPGDHPQYIDLTPSLSVPRRALHALNPPLRPGARWTLPVLYQEQQLLEVVRSGAAPGGAAATAPAAPAPAAPAPVPAGPAVPPNSAEVWRLLRARAETVAGALAALPPNTPESAREHMLALLDDAPPVPQALRPDRWGQFGAGG